jgi:hypothetical protein
MCSIKPAHLFLSTLKAILEKDSDDGVCCTELLGLFWTLSIVFYVEDKKYHNVSETGSVFVLGWMGLFLTGPTE